MSAGSPVLISVDWGSSNMRACLLDGEGRVLEERRSNRGMLKLAQEDFSRVLLGEVGPWLEARSLPLLLAGMVGSAHGWRDAGYLSCPMQLSELHRHLCPVDDCDGLSIHIVPGLRGQSPFGQSEVMRGEEVQILGALRVLQGRRLDAATMPLCLPGTHSKWAALSSLDPHTARVEQFATCMTGELFDLLCRHSLLGRPLAGLDLARETDWSAFEAGLERAGQGGGLSHALFSARTTVLDESIPVSGLPSYLSGLLIGSEVVAMTGQGPAGGKVCLVGNAALNGLYSHALQRVGWEAELVDGDLAARNGMLELARGAGLIS